MDVFISWSGNKSKALAEILRDWLPTVIQAVRPYFTPDDISKGTKWNSEISKKLEVCQIGLFCITPDNFTSPWILFEAGALSKNFDKSRVCPILFGLDPTDITGPFVQFQLTQFNREDIFRLIGTMNQELGEDKIVNEILGTVFEAMWPKLEKMVSEELSKSTKTKDELVKRSDRELLEEILSIVRTNADDSQYHILPDVLSEIVGGYLELVSETAELDENISLISGLLRIGNPIKYILVKNLADKVTLARFTKAFEFLYKISVRTGETPSTPFKSLSSDIPTNESESP